MLGKQNDSRTFYAVDYSWYSEWRAFLDKGGREPREIENQVLRNYIYKERQRQGYKSDESLGLTEGEDYVVLNEA